MDAESVADEFFEILTNIANGESLPNELSIFLKSIEDECENEQLEYKSFLEEVFPDPICETVNEIVNDSEWRSDETGPSAIFDENVLRQLFPILCAIDQNIEIVYATNPNAPADIVQVLSESTHQWEEDGTTSALARNTSDQAILKKLASNSDPSTRYSVAANPNTPSEILEFLSTDEAFSNHMMYRSFDGGWYGQTPMAVGYVRCSIKFAVLANPSTALEVVKKIAQNPKNFDLSSEDDAFGMTHEEVNQAVQHEALGVLQSRTKN